MVSHRETVDPFAEDQVSPSISALNAPQFLKEYGVFYQASAEVGNEVAQLERDGVTWEPDSFKRLLPILIKDTRIQQILDSFDTNCRPACWVFGSNYPNHYFASTIRVDEDEDHKIAVYACSAGSELEIFVRSQYLPSAGVKASNGMYEIPYPFLRDTKNLRERQVRMMGGGVLIVHPRFAIESHGGRAIGYGLPEKNYKFRGTPPK